MKRKNRARTIRQAFCERETASAASEGPAPQGGGEKPKHVAPGKGCPVPLGRHPLKRAGDIDGQGHWRTAEHQGQLLPKYLHWAVP